MKKRIRYWWPAILMMLLIFIASSMPGRDLPGFGAWDFIVKKGGHLTGYALLGIALLRGLTSGGVASRRQALLALLLATFYAATDEFHQRFTPGRSSSIADVATDALGAALGLPAWIRLRKALNPAAGSNGAALRQKLSGRTGSGV